MWNHRSLAPPGPLPKRLNETMKERKNGKKKEWKKERMEKRKREKKCIHCECSKEIWESKKKTKEGRKGGNDSQKDERFVIQERND